MNNDAVEYYIKKKLLKRIQSSIIPREGTSIDICKIDYLVDAVSYVIDYADDPNDAQTVATVTLVPITLKWAKPAPYLGPTKANP